MSELSLETIIKTKFSSHRGEVLPGVEQNSLAAISAGLLLHPPFIEFDVVAAPDGVIRTGHPPQKPMDSLDAVLDIFLLDEPKGQATYPKIDIKPTADKETLALIDGVLDIVILKELPLALMTLEGGKMASDEYLPLQRHLANRIREYPSIRLSFDIANLDGVEDGTVVNEHMRALGDTVVAVAAEVHEHDFDTVGHFAQKYGIGKIEFWMRGAPDTTNASVDEQTILEALTLEEQYDAVVYFDINRQYVLPNSGEVKSRKQCPVRGGT